MRQRFGRVAAEDPTKLGQKARVLMGMVRTIEKNGAMSPLSRPLLWDASGDELIGRQTEDLERLVARPDVAVDDVQQNLIARAGLLIDLHVVHPAMYELQPAAARVCARFPEQQVSLCPCCCLSVKMIPVPVLLPVGDDEY